MSNRSKKKKYVSVIEVDSKNETLSGSNDRVRCVTAVRVMNLSDTDFQRIPDSLRPEGGIISYDYDVNISSEFSRIKGSLLHYGWSATKTISLNDEVQFRTDFFEKKYLSSEKNIDEEEEVEF